MEKILMAFPEIDVAWLITGNIGIKPETRQQSLNFEASTATAASINDRKEIVDQSLKDDGLRAEMIVIIYPNGTFRILKPFDNKV
jgi:hypothetical protein